MKNIEIAKKLSRKVGKFKIRTRWLFNEIVDGLLPSPLYLTCPICEFSNDPSKFKVYHSYCIFNGGKLVRHECPECGVIFGTQRMLALTPEELGQEYIEHYSCYHEGDSTSSELKTFYYLNPKPEGIYLNFGCGEWSQTIEEARKEGYQLFGFDPYSANTNDEFIINDINVIKKMGFDGIMSNNVLEHIRYPDEVLSLMASLLKSENCAMVHTTPCYDYCYEYTRFHLYFFAGNSLEYICRKVNLRFENTDNKDTKIFYKNV